MSHFYLRLHIFMISLMETTSFSSETQRFRLETQIYIEDPKLYIKDPKCFNEDHKFFIGEPILFILNPQFLLETPENLGVIRQKRSLKWKACGLRGKFWGLRHLFQVFFFKLKKNLKFENNCSLLRRWNIIWIDYLLNSSLEKKIIGKIINSFKKLKY